MFLLIEIRGFVIFPARIRYFSAKNNDIHSNNRFLCLAFATFISMGEISHNHEVIGMGQGGPVSSSQVMEEGGLINTTDTYGMKNPVKAVVLVALWRSRGRFVSRVLYPSDTLLARFVGHKAVASILNTNIYFRTSIIKWYDKAIVLTLPAALNPTWERLWRRNERLVVELTIEITKEGENIGDEP